MSMHTDVKNGDELILVQSKLGFVRGWAAEDKGQLEGLAYLSVHVNSAELPGVSEMTVNVNSWDVTHANAPVILKKIAEKYVRMDLVR